MLRLRRSLQLLPWKRSCLRPNTAISSMINQYRCLSSQSSESEKPSALGIARDVLSEQGDSSSSKLPSNRQSLKRIISLLKPEIGPLSISVGTLGITTAISLVFPAAVGHILDIALAPTPSMTPASIALGMFGLFTIQTVFMGIRTTMLANMGERVANRIRK